MIFAPQEVAGSDSFSTDEPAETDLIDTDHHCGGTGVLFLQGILLVFKTPKSLQLGIGAPALTTPQSPEFLEVPRQLPLASLSTPPLSSKEIDSEEADNLSLVLWHSSIEQHPGTTQLQPRREC